MNEPLRICRVCGVEALSEDDLNQFEKGKKGKHGHRNRCKKCQAKYSSIRQKTPAFIKRQKEIYHKKHPHAKYGRGSLPGKDSSRWKGNAVSISGSRMRLYDPSSPTHIAIPKGFERHHKDGNPFNNNSNNISIVTRKEHMELDGRMFRRDKGGRFSSNE